MPGSDGLCHLVTYIISNPRVLSQVPTCDSAGKIRQSLPHANVGPREVHRELGLEAEIDFVHVVHLVVAAHVEIESSG